MKKFWWPFWAYESRPWATLTFGTVIGAIALAVSLYRGNWTLPVTLLFGFGAALAIYGGILVQLRREYRESSKWARTHTPEEIKKSLDRER